jgi:hypothetical protein
VKLTTHLHLVPRSRLVELYLNSPIRLHGVVHRDNFTFLPPSWIWSSWWYSLKGRNYGALDFVIFSSLQRSITRPLYLRIPRICGPLARNNLSDGLDHSYHTIHCAPHHLEITREVMEMQYRAPTGVLMSGVRQYFRRPIVSVLVTWREQTVTPRNSWWSPSYLRGRVTK